MEKGFVELPISEHHLEWQELAGPQDCIWSRTWQRSRQIPSFGCLEE